MVRRVGAWDSHVEGLKWTLLAALGVAACSGRSVRHSTSEGGDAGDTGAGATGGARGGGKATGGNGGRPPKGGSGPGLDGGSSFGARGGVGASGGVGAEGGVGGTGAVSGMGGTIGEGGDHGFRPEGCAAATGYGQNVALCRGGFVHRVGTMSECSLPPRSVAGSAGADGEGGTSQGGANDGSSGAGGAGIEGECMNDWDCERRPNGFCVLATDRAPEDTHSYCHYACASDSDCATSEVCSCGESFLAFGTDESLQLGVCTGATCRSDAECGDGLLCSSPLDAECGPARPTGYRCQSREDQCAGPEDCADDEECTHDGERFECSGRFVCGRPFIVGEQVRLAGSAPRDDWGGAPVRLASEELDDSTRTAIVRHWTNAALAEHASVAAFARFTLELMALGASRELVEGSVCAMGDETRHATLCFGLASRYAGTAIGPTALDLSGAFADSDFLAVVDRAVVEGVIGETTAALEAAWAREVATDPEVRAALATIAEDESRHAALAFRFLAWTAKRDPRVLPLVERRFREAVHAHEREKSVPSSLAASSRKQLEGHGVLDAATRRAARRAVLSDVLPPVIAELRAGACPQLGYAGKHGEANRCLG